MFRPKTGVRVDQDLGGPPYAVDRSSSDWARRCASKERLVQ